MRISKLRGPARRRAASARPSSPVEPGAGGGTRVPVRARRAPRDDRGAALVIACLMVTMLTMLGAVALSQAVNASNQSASTLRQLQVQAAARAGLDAAIASVESQLNSGVTTLTCPTASTIGANINSPGASVAVNNASGESYTLNYQIFTTAPTSSQLQALETGTAGSACSSSSTTNIAVMSSEPSNWYLAMAARGATTSVLQSFSANYSVTVLAISQSVATQFNDGLYGGQYINTPGNLQMTGSGTTYTNGSLDCGQTNDYLAGDVWALGGVTTGSCTVAGNLYVTGNIDLTASGTVDKGLFATGAVAESGNSVVDGNIVANGDLDFSGSGRVVGNAYIAGTNSTTNAATGASNSCGSKKSPVSTSACFDSGNNPEAVNVYSANGPITVKNAAVGAQYPSTAWPSCAVPSGSGLTCTGSTLNALPTQSLPSLAPGPWSSQTTGTTVSWDGQLWTYINDTADTCTGSYATGTAAKAIYADIKNATTPTLIDTPCAMWWDDFGGTLSGFTLSTSVAIFASAGFNFDNTIGKWVTGTGSNDLYLMVPCSSTCASGSLPASAGAISEGANCSAASSLPTSGDIWLSSQLSSVNTFVYTPDNVCSGSTPSLTGQVYAGGYVDMSGGLTLVANTLVSSGLTSAGSGATMSVQEIQ